MSIARAVILAAGVGRRLTRSNGRSPKCLLSFGGHTLLERQLAMLHRAGIDQIGIVTGWRAEEIEAALRGRHPSFGACVDTGHFIRSGVDPAEAIRRFGARVHGVHLKDFVEPGALADGCILGQGLLQLDPVFRSLREVEFSGALSLEYERNPEHVIPDLVASLEAASAAAQRAALG